jgi:hypothetical protein
MSNIFKKDFILNPNFAEGKYKVIDQLNNTKRRYNTIKYNLQKKQYNKISPSLRNNKLLTEYLT